jgi:hypothetical protein
MLLALLFIGTAFAILASFEAGLRLGRWRSRRPDLEPLLPARMIISSVLSLLAFILAFTFGLATSHSDSRSKAIDDEAIAIATAYRRADLLPEPERTQVRHTLREYVDRRLEASRSTNVDEMMIARLRRLQGQIWALAIAAGRNEAAPGPSTSVIQSLNDVIDVQAERVLTNMRSRIPVPVWIILYAITMVSIAAAGYASGIAGNRGRSFAALAYALVFSGVILMIADLDLPKFGVFQSNYQAFRDLSERLDSGRP